MTGCFQDSNLNSSMLAGAALYVQSMTMHPCILHLSSAYNPGPLSAQCSVLQQLVRCRIPDAKGLSLVQAGCRPQQRPCSACRYCLYEASSVQVPCLHPAHERLDGVRAAGPRCTCRARQAAAAAGDVRQTTYYPQSITKYP
jgi:hypothetical protein